MQSEPPGRVNSESAKGVRNISTEGGGVRSMGSQRNINESDKNLRGDKKRVRKKKHARVYPGSPCAPDKDLILPR